MYCIINGIIIEEDKAFIGIKDLALQRGYGIFDFFRLSEGVPMFLEDHLNRFYSSAEQVRLEVPFQKSELKGLLQRLFEKNNMSLSGIKLLVTGGYTPNGYDIAKPNLIITQMPITFPPEQIYQNGVKIITHEYLRDLPTVKTINYMTGIWLLDMIREQKAYDVLYHFKNEVLEITRSNIFIVAQNNEIITPKENVLLGITRKTLIKKAYDRYKVVERSVPLDELFSAKEVFLTGTTKKVLPITQIDDHIYGDGKPGKVTKELMELFKEVEEKYLMEHSF